MKDTVTSCQQRVKVDRVIRFPKSEQDSNFEIYSYFKLGVIYRGRYRRCVLYLKLFCNEYLKRGPYEERSLYCYADACEQLCFDVTQRQSHAACTFKNIDSRDEERREKQTKAWRQVKRGNADTALLS
jgi:hypothetical protein